jgi:hypothetical protein
MPRKSLIRLAHIAIVAPSIAALPIGAAAALSSTSRIGPTGVGPVVIGTTPAQARATGTPLVASVPAPGSSCFYLRPAALKGLAFLVEAGTIRRSEVRARAYATVDGLRVGDSLAKIRAVYGSRAKAAPAKYAPDGQTVTLAPRGTGEAKYRTVFALRNGVVTAIFAGALPQVLYVEGCA